MSATPDFVTLRRVIADLAGDVVAIGGGHRGAQVCTLMRRMLTGEDVADQDIGAALAGHRNGTVRGRNPAHLPSNRGKSVAIVTLHGIATYNCEAQPFAYSSVLLARNIAELAADAAVDSILLDVDSPGGQVNGVPESADAIFRARQAKPVIAFANPLAASAAYWLSSQASYVVAPQSGDVGSIGVFVVHLDQSKAMSKAGLEITFIQNDRSPHKTEGHSFSPLGIEARGHIQTEVNLLGRGFIEAVGRGRNVSVNKVERDFGQGRVMRSAMALKAGMIDHIGGMDEAFRLAMDPPGFRAGRLATLAKPTEREQSALARRQRLANLRV